MNDLTKIAADIVESQINLLTEVRIIEVVDEPTMKHAQGLLGTVRELRKSIEDFCNPAVQAAHEAHQAANAQKKALLAPTAAAETILRDKLKAFAAQEEKKRREQEAAIRKAQEAAAPAGELDLAPPTVKVDSVIDQGGFRTRWGFEVIDEALIPREYLIVDMAAIGAVVRAQKDKTAIPGVRVYSEKIPVA